jgi:hypothetical protein
LDPPLRLAAWNHRTVTATPYLLMNRDSLAGPSELLWAQGGQIDFYDQPDQVSLAVDAADRHFRRTLT